MPTYIYKNKKGEEIEIIMTIAEMTQKQFKENGKEFIIHEGEKLKRVFVSNSNCHGTWPLISTFAGIHPNQVPQFMEEEKRLGIPTEYTKDGDPILRDKEHRRKYLKSRNLFDRDAGYGDPVPSK